MVIYINNQYIGSEYSEEELKNIEVIIDKKNQKIEELGIEEDPNILICYESERGSFMNIYHSVRVIITDRESVKINIEELMESRIERVVVEGVIYKKPDRYEYIGFIDDIEERERIIREKMERGEYNIVNSEGSTLIHSMIELMMYRECNEIIEKVSEEVINKEDIAERSIFDLICDIDGEYGEYEEYKKLCRNIIRRMDKGKINRKKKSGVNNLMVLCYRENREMIEEIIEYMEEERFYEEDRSGITALYMAIYNGMEEVGIKILDRIKDEEKKRELVNRDINGSILLEICENKKLKRLSERIEGYTSEVNKVLLNIRRQLRK